MNTVFQIETFLANKYRILQDFQIILDYFSLNKIEISRKNNRISTKNVIELNKILSKNLLLDLKQHNQTSYPHINSLILLFRASGFGIVKLENETLILTINIDLYKQWNALNETEKYFNLFITWICNGVPSIVGIEEDLIHSFNNLLHFMTTNLSESNISQSDTKSLDSAKYSVGTHNLTLLEMFGFIEITDNSNVLSKKWSITELKFTQLGIYIFQIIKSVLKKSKKEFYCGNIFPISIKNLLQKQVRSLFKDYKTDLQLTDNIQIENDLIFKVNLGRVYRKIAIPSDYSLDCFCDYIIDCFDFDHTHLYNLIIKNRFGYNETYTHPEIDDDDAGNPNSADFTLKSLFLNAGSTMDFTYDFGDNWQFEIICEKVDNVKSKKPRIIEKKGKAPEQYSHNIW